MCLCVCVRIVCPRWRAQEWIKRRLATCPLPGITLCDRLANLSAASAAANNNNNNNSTPNYNAPIMLSGPPKTHCDLLARVDSALRPCLLRGSQQPGAYYVMVSDWSLPEGEQRVLVMVDHVVRSRVARCALRVARCASPSPPSSSLVQVAVILLIRRSNAVLCPRVRDVAYVRSS